MGVSSFESLGERIERAPDCESLGRLRRTMWEEGRQRSFFFSRDSVEEVALINDMHDRIIRRAVALAEQRAAAEGGGAPPAAYELLLFGSGGRREQTLWSDQDNGLVFHYAADADQDRQDMTGYFRRLSECVVEGLQAAGYPPCDGKVICTNRQWRKNEEEFRQMVRRWMAEPSWENIRYLLIAADCRAVTGTGAMCGQIRFEIDDYIARNPEVLPYLLKNTLRHKVIVGLFGQLLKEQYGEEAGGVDIKYGAYIPMVNAIRLLSLEERIPHTNTLERIRALEANGTITSRTAENWRDAFATILKFRNMLSFKEENGMFYNKNILRLDHLPREHIQELKECLKIGKELQRAVRQRVGRAGWE